MKTKSNFGKYTELQKEKIQKDHWWNKSITYLNSFSQVVNNYSPEERKVIHIILPM